MKFKKPKFWDLKKPNLISNIFLPLTLPIEINNFFLKKKIKKKNDKIKTICVGNIYIGGTGKTPTTLKLSKILKELKLKTCIGKKYYSSHIDEKMILEKKTNLICLESRQEIIKSAIEQKYDFLIFDDGLQDKKVSYDLEFVCFDAHNWIGNGNLLPSGPLREKVSSLKKYDAVFLKDNDPKIDTIEKSIKEINPNIKIFNTNYKILNINEFNLNDNYLAFSGIGNPLSFKKTLIKNKFKIIDEIIFPDHFNYKKKDIDQIKKRAKNINAKIITTEKDFSKISKIDNTDINFVEVDLVIENDTDLINFLKSKIYE